VLGAAAVCLALALAGTRGLIDPGLGQAALFAFFAALFGALWFGIAARRQALADREKEMGGLLIVTIAAQLGKQDDPTLERIAARGGPAGDAAAWILEGRRTRGRSEKP